MWPSDNRFYERGFGVLAIRADEMICWCTSEYVSASKCGIGIATAPAYQNLGVASVTASRCVEKAWGRGVQPHWECAASNRPSARVAEKVGFTLLGEER